MSRKLNIGFLGMGQCGGNIADLAEKHGYRTAVINTAQEDLDAVENVRNKLLIGTQLGCGKDRNVAKSEVKSYHKEIVEFVRNTFSNSCDIIYVVTSASGGTGSGMSPIVVDLLRRTMPTQKFGM